jgi:hypothetical protein
VATRKAIHSGLPRRQLVFQNEGAADGLISGQRATQSSLIIDIFNSTAYKKFQGF